MLFFCFTMVVMFSGFASACFGGGSLSAVTTPTTQKGSHNHLVLLNGLSLIGKPMAKEIYRSSNH